MAAVNSAIDVFDEKSAGYRQYVLDHWYELDEWERAHYASFSQWAADRKRVRRFVSTPGAAVGAHTPFLGESYLGESRFPRSISLAYALAIVGIVFFPFILESAAILLALVNMICRRWEHALLQLGIALAVLGFAELGHSLSTVVAPLLVRAFGL